MDQEETHKYIKDYLVSLGVEEWIQEKGHTRGGRDGQAVLSHRKCRHSERPDKRDTIGFRPLLEVPEIQ